jgi:hypothetical protein
MTEKQFGQKMTILAEVLGRVELSRPMILSYHKIMSHLDDFTINRAFNRAASECVHFPRPAELLRLAGVSNEAVEAFNLVTDAIERVGPYASITFGPHINAVIERMGGWQQICRASADEWQAFRRKEFMVLYQCEYDNAPVSLKGIEAVCNERFGIEPEIVPIGDGSRKAIGEGK